MSVAFCFACAQFAPTACNSSHSSRVPCSLPQVYEGHVDHEGDFRLVIGLDDHFVLEYVSTSGGVAFPRESFSRGRIERLHDQLVFVEEEKLGRPGERSLHVYVSIRGALEYPLWWPLSGGGERFGGYVSLKHYILDADPAGHPLPDLLPRIDNVERHQPAGDR